MSSDQSLGALPEELNIGSNIPHDPTPTHMSGGYMESQALFYNLRVYRNSSWLEVGLELGNCVFTRMALKLGRTSASQREACIALYPGQLCPALHQGWHATCCDSPAPLGVRRQSASPTAELLEDDHLLNKVPTGWLRLGARPGLSSASVNKADPNRQYNLTFYEPFLSSWNGTSLRVLCLFLCNRNTTAIGKQVMTISKEH